MDDDTVELRDAEHIWGTTIPEMEVAFKKEIGGPKCDILGVGPAGERMVRLASVANYIRFAGKGGSGAVMGSKNLKAIVIRGFGKIELTDPDRLSEIRGEITKAMKESPPIQALKRWLGILILRRQVQIITVVDTQWAQRCFKPQTRAYTMAES